MFRVEALDELPLTLRHERIYILPSRRGLALVAVILVMLLASINYGLNLGYALSFILIGLFASCLLATYQNLANLKVQTASANDTFVGDSLDFEITLGDSNKSHRHSISLRSANGGFDCIDITALQNTTATLRLTAVSRGYHTLGRIAISSDYPLGLWRGWGYIHPPAGGFVYPAPEHPRPRFAAQENAGGKQAQQLHEREFSELKRYEKTDPPGSVAWKTVARGNGWYSKSFAPETADNALKLRWQDTPAGADTESRLSRLCAWVQQAGESSMEYSLELPGKVVRSSSGAQHRRHCLQQLAVFKEN